MIKFVYFDFGGVLTESGRSGFVSETLADLYEVEPAQLDIGFYHGELRRGRGRDQDLFDYLNRKFGKEVTRDMFLRAAHTEFFPSHEVYKLAERLRTAGIGTGLLSNVFTMNAEELKKQGWYDGFEPIILSCDVGYAKPDAQIYDIAIEQSGVDAEEILFIDDQQKCLDPAKNRGFHTVQAIAPHQIVSDVEKLIRKLNDTDLS